MVMLEDIKVGMTLAEPVLGKFDLLYAHAEETIDDNMLDGLRRLDIPFVFVKEIDSESDTLGYNTDASPEFIKAKENYNEMLDLMSQIFEDFHFLDKKVINRVQKPMTSLIESVTVNTSLLLKLKKLYLKDQYSLTHSIHVCLLSAMIAKWNGLRNRDIEAVGMAGLFHDLGKSKIPSEILNKPSELTASETNIMKRHSELGYELAKAQDVFAADILRGIIEHHERMDGTGYPQGLKKEQIHPYAQIIAIADVYDAMTTERSYKNSESPFVAVEIIKDLSYRQHLNPALVNRFLKNIYRLYIGAQVILTNGKAGEIIYINPFSPERPLIRLHEGFIDLYTTPSVHIKSFKVS
jgi:putative nucleotidyltransferase with HDIG domain